MELIDEVLETIEKIEKNPHKTTEEQLQIAQIKALVVIARVIEESAQHRS
jgi:hypothetical protein